jgi:hypothetical protein
VSATHSQLAIEFTALLVDERRPLAAHSFLQRGTARCLQTIDVHKHTPPGNQMQILEVFVEKSK